MVNKMAVNKMTRYNGGKQNDQTMTVQNDHT